MAIEPGTRFGPYEVADEIGAGGMGVVYRATDTNLKRDVAVKVLPESLATDAERLTRFQREAELLASLNHTNIAQIYGLEKVDGATALVMELVEGPTLEDRIRQGAIPADEALGLAMQIAEALEAAHGQTIVHRDLKPANIKLRSDGVVKVLDFGIAKALEQDTLTSAPQSPMLTTPATQVGVILGTAAYMSPEQAKGKLVDQRADIWAFGCLLYEMLTGQPTFGGEDVPTTLARVLERETDFDALPAAISPVVRRTIELCVQKDLKKRVADIRDVRLALEGAFQAETQLPSHDEAGGLSGQRWGFASSAALLSAAVVGSLLWLLAPPPPGDVLPTSFIIRTPADVPLYRDAPLALSPDGRELVYMVGGGAERRLFHQSLSGFEPREIDDGQRISGLFFSPSGDAIGIYSGAADQLQRLDLAGGSPTRLIDSEGFLGAGWGEDGIIVFSPDWGQSLRVVRPGESVAVDLTQIDEEARERSHLWPQILPGNRVLFTIWSGAPSWDEAQLAVADMETGQHTVVLRGGAFGRYASSGHLVFWRGESLMAAGFDPKTLTVTGEPIRVVRDVRLDLSTGRVDFAISRGGTLAYVEGGEDAFAESFVVDRSGQQVVRLDDAGPTGMPVFSPDGARLALTLYRGGTFGVGVFDVERGLLTPIALTSDSYRPAWTSDGERVTFLSNLDGEYSLHTLQSDGSGAPEPLFDEPQGIVTTRSAWSPDGMHLVYDKFGENGRDIWVHEPAGNTEPRPLISTAADEIAPSFSPDGKFIVHQSNESGPSQIYVRPFPEVDTRRELISGSGGMLPVWSRDGSEIFYVSEAGLMQVLVSYSEAGVPSFGQPSLAIDVSGIGNFDVSPDGQMFAIERVPVETAAKEIHVVVNWFEELERLVPTN